MTISPSALHIVATALFALAVVHTFSTAYFERLAHASPRHAGAFHLLGEVEVVFGVWAMVLLLFMMAAAGQDAAADYLESRNFTEPLFVFAIMVVAGSRPILGLAMSLVRSIAAFIPFGGAIGFTFVALAFVPLLGSFITEPAAMTLAALILRDKLFSAGVSDRLKYAALGTLFVNISIGGTLTPFAAPPVLMVAGKWGWDTWFMLASFGWKAGLAVAVNALALCMWFRRELATLADRPSDKTGSLPPVVMAIHVAFLVTIVVFAHRPAVFMAVLVAFLGFASAYRRYQGPLMLREGLLVAVFLAGLVVLGGQQRWWLEPLLSGMDANTVYFGATVLTAVTDNAALTYLGSLVEGTTPEFRYSLVAGAVTGGGLTVIANAPNPAGFAILREHFTDGTIRPLGLFIAALAPTIVTILAFRAL
jgi:hypothetical protein